MGRRSELAARLGCSPDYLWQVAVGFQPKGAVRPKRPGPKLARRIEEETKAMGTAARKRWTVRKESLRPDLWK